MIQGDFFVRFRRSELDAALRGVDRNKAALIRAHLDRPGAQVLAGIAFHLGVGLGRGEPGTGLTAPDEIADRWEHQAMLASRIAPTTHPRAWRSFKESLHSPPALRLLRAAMNEAVQLAADDVDASLEELAARSRVVER